MDGFDGEPHLAILGVEHACGGQFVEERHQRQAFAQLLAGGEPHF